MHAATGSDSTHVIINAKETLERTREKIVKSQFLKHIKLQRPLAPALFTPMYMHILYILVCGREENKSELIVKSEVIKWQKVSRAE
jgi:hypothetical protein